MPQPKKAARFGGSPAHHNMILSNLATELIRHGRINTTYAKAKNVQPVAEKMITFAKRGDIHARRQVLKVIRDKDVVHKLFADVGPAFAERDGGYTRVLKTGPRKGDAAPMAIIELVEGVSTGREGGELEEAPTRRWSLRRRRGSVSATARARQEERAAAFDRGEDPDFGEGADDNAEAVPTGTLDERETADQADEVEASARAADDEEEAPQADPAEVEARLAAEEAEPGEEADAAEPERPADEEEAGAVTDEPEVSPTPTEEQEAPAPERPADEDDADKA